MEEVPWQIFPYQNRKPPSMESGLTNQNEEMGTRKHNILRTRG
jgi:hypothetical protein